MNKMLEKILLHNHEFLLHFTNVVSGIILSIIAGLILIITEDYSNIIPLVILIITVFFILRIVLRLNEINRLIKKKLDTEIKKLDNDSLKNFNYFHQEFIYRKEYINNYFSKLRNNIFICSFLLLLGLFFCNSSLANLVFPSDNKHDQLLEEIINDTKELISSTNSNYESIQEKMNYYSQDSETLLELNAILISKIDSLKDINSGLLMNKTNQKDSISPDTN